MLPALTPKPASENNPQQGLVTTSKVFQSPNLTKQVEPHSLSDRAHNRPRTFCLTALKLGLA